MKRQADTTTPSTGQPSPSSIVPIPLPPLSGVGVAHHPLPLVPHRRESTRQVKRPKLDLPGEMTYQQEVSAGEQDNLSTVDIFIVPKCPKVTHNSNL